MKWDRKIWAHYFNSDTAQSKVEVLLQTSSMQYFHNPNVAPFSPLFKAHSICRDRNQNQYSHWRKAEKVKHGLKKK